jgi:multiple antibiotic resistance protein
MNELTGSFLTVFAGLFPIVNPLGMAPIFLHLTSDATEQIRAKLAWQIAVGGFVLMAVSLFVGSHILSFFGLTIAAVQIAGGLVVMTAEWRMLQQGHEPRVREQQAGASEDSIMRRAFFL